MAGEPGVELGNLEGRANILGEILRSNAYPIRNRATTEWVVRQPAGSTVTLTARCPEAGVARVEVVLRSGRRTRGPLPVASPEPRRSGWRCPAWG